MKLCLRDYIGKYVQLWCLNYIYVGKLVHLSDDDAVLEEPGVIFETGPFTQKKSKDVQYLPVKTWTVCRKTIESFGSAFQDYP